MKPNFNILKLSFKSAVLAIIIFIIMLFMAVAFNVIFSNHDSSSTTSSSSQDQSLPIDKPIAAVQNPNDNTYVLNNLRIKFNIPTDWTGNITDVVGEGDGVKKIVFKSVNNNEIDFHLSPNLPTKTSGRETGGNIEYEPSSLLNIGTLGNVQIFRKKDLAPIFEGQGAQNGYTFTIYGIDSLKKATSPFIVNGYLASIIYFVQEPDIKLANAESILQKIDAIMLKIHFQ